MNAPENISLSSLHLRKRRWPRADTRPVPETSWRAIRNGGNRSARGYIIFGPGSPGLSAAEPRTPSSCSICVRWRGISRSSRSSRSDPGVDGSLQDGGGGFLALREARVREAQVSGGCRIVQVDARPDLHRAQNASPRLSP